MLIDAFPVSDGMKYIILSVVSDLFLIDEQSQLWHWSENVDFFV